MARVAEAMEIIVVLGDKLNGELWTSSGLERVGFVYFDIQVVVRGSLRKEHTVAGG